MPKKIYKKNDYFDENYSFGINFVNERLNSSLEPHIHEFIEISYVVNGSGKHYVDGYISDANKGDLFILDIDMGHKFYSESPEENLMTYNIMFTPDFIDDTVFICEDFRHLNKFRMFKSFFPHISPKYDLHFDSSEQEEIESIISVIYKEYSAKKTGYITVVRGCLTALIARIMRGLSQYSDDDIVNFYSANHEMILKIIENMEQNYHNKLNLDELARVSLFSKGHLCNIFKKETGMTLSEYINRIRINEACKLIENDPDVNLSKLAYKIGFGDYKRFYKTFKDITGMTPSEKCGIFHRK